MLGRGHAVIARHGEKPWASITFSGSRHTIALAFHGADAVAAGEELVAALPDHEFTIPGQIVADAQVVAVAHTMLPRPVLEVEVEVLLLEDA
ncbi:MAG: hypothetical protein IE933_11960 [Sphingomonadales bacterium]|nr:hypothetical protein [Sphingomonadales bacterium]MBD3774738.1 hypothetical protein [Paracoccaceae bacterium]